MRITGLRIRNFKSIKEMRVDSVENALILVGKNSTGKTAVLDAIRAVGGSYQIRAEDFQEDYPNIEVLVTLELTKEDLERFHQYGVVSQYHRYDIWERDFMAKLPSFSDGGLTFEFTANREGKVRFGDGIRKHNLYLREVFPQICYVDAARNLGQLQDGLLMLQEDEALKRMRSDCCIFDRAKCCNHCFDCIGLIDQKSPKQLNALEAVRLLDYKLYQLGLDGFARRVNENFHKNGGQEEIVFSMNRDMERMLRVTAEVKGKGKGRLRPIERMGEGMRSVYLLSLLETYTEGPDWMPSIMMVEDPEIFLHPRLQRISGEILYRLSLKNQVVFSTHSPNLLANFSSRQIRQVYLDEEGYSQVRERTDISAILDDLGYSASDLMNVDFVFIVEGKQDKSRLPLLIRKYYPETRDGQGRLSRIAIITTNSCTNIKTYANLKYMNQIYLKEQFLMIRDGDGQDPVKLRRTLCKYYEERNLEDVDKLPQVTDKNVLVLKYYSFENYFLNPDVMASLGVVPDSESFYQTLLEKWKEYLYRTSSGQRLSKVLGKGFETAEDVKTHMEEIKVHVRGHNLFDIFYGRYRDQKEGPLEDLLARYIELAPREDFADILDSIDRFIYFESRRVAGQ